MAPSISGDVIDAHDSGDGLRPAPVRGTCVAEDDDTNDFAGAHGLDE
ncbi:MAG: hypothetical protein L0H59_00835 [Tomitella sp.]|nr:hypothetical protein [Tomitella sp.]